MTSLTGRIVETIRTHPAALRLKFMSKNPFRERDGRLLVFCCHHKVGTSWFGKILSAVSKEFGLPMIHDDQSKLHDYPAIFFQNHSRMDLSRLENYRGAHIIRDPRDVVVSGYHYHLWTKEAWARTPIKDLPADIETVWPLLPIKDIRHLSYRQYLNSLSTEEGLMAEMYRASTTEIRDIVVWNYKNRDFFEFKYETIMQNENEVLHRMFEHYGFTRDAVTRSLQIAARFSFKNRTNRKPGEVNAKSHLRSGKLQRWKDEFNDEHKGAFQRTAWCRSC